MCPTLLRMAAFSKMVYRKFNQSSVLPGIRRKTTRRNTVLRRVPVNAGCVAPENNKRKDLATGTKSFLWAYQ
jgi:hypothetical protein